MNKFLILLLANFLLVTLSLTLNAKPQNQPIKGLRIVALAPHIVENLFEIGAGKHIVGTVEYADFPEQAKSIPRIGGYYGLKIEKIMALKPDVIFAWKSGNKTADLEQLERLGSMRIIYSEAKNVDDVATELRTFGAVLDAGLGNKVSNDAINNIVKKNKYQQQAEVAAKLFEKRLATIKKTYQDKKSIKVFYQLWSQPMMTINENTLINQLIIVCQGDNVFANNVTEYPQISIENVMLAQPELIILPDEKSDKPQPKIAWHKWPEIPAVKANAFIHVNADLLHRFSTRMLDGVENMCKKMDSYRSVITK